MAKLTIEIENGEIKKTLKIRGKELTFTMKPCDFGMKSDKPCFLNQAEKELPNIMNDELAEAIDCIEFADDDEALECLEILDAYEVIE